MKNSMHLVCTGYGRHCVVIHCHNVEQRPMDQEPVHDLVQQWRDAVIEQADDCGDLSLPLTDPRRKPHPKKAKCAFDRAYRDDKQLRATPESRRGNLRADERRAPLGAFSSRSVAIVLGIGRRRSACRKSWRRTLLSLVSRRKWGSRRSPQARFRSNSRWSQPPDDGTWDCAGRWAGEPS